MKTRNNLMNLRNLTKYAIVSLVCIMAVFLFGCEQEGNMLDEEELTGIHPRVEAIVEDAPGNRSIKTELKKELQFLIDNGYVDIDSEYLHVYFNDEAPDGYKYSFQYNYDQEMVRARIHEIMEEYKKAQEKPEEEGDGSVTLREHRHAGTTSNPNFVDNGSYTVYVHTSLPSVWVTALANAYVEYNDLNLTIDFSGQVTSSTYNYGGITVHDANLPSGILASAPDPSGGNPGYRIRIDTDDASGLSASQKKLLLAHELGHTIGFRHTDTSEEAPATSNNYGCISSSCDGMDGNSIMNSWDPIPTWAGFSVCDEEVFECIYGSLV